MIKNIDEKLNEVLPRLAKIESRLEKLDPSVNTEFSEIKSSVSDILLEVRGNSQSVGSIPDNTRRASNTSDSVSQTSTSELRSVRGYESSVSDPKIGVIMSDCDMSEMAANTGHLLSCQVDMVNYSAGLSDPSLFERELQFVMIQASGRVLDKYEEVTTEITQELTAHVQTLVKVATNILDMQPGIKVFLGCLPPRFDSRVKRELTKIYNSLLVTQSFMVNEIVVVDQSQLQTEDERKLYERYQEDLVTLTRYGDKLMEKNIAYQIAQAVDGLSVLRPRKPNRKVKHHHKLSHAQWGGKGYRNQQLKSFLTDVLNSL